MSDRSRDNELDDVVEIPDELLKDIAGGATSVPPPSVPAPC